MRISQISKTKQFSIAVPSMISILRSRAHQHGDRTAFTMLAQPGDEGQSITYAELDFAARRIGGYLSKVVDPGEPVLLFIPPSLEYIAAFLGCLYARVVAVPLYPPRINEKPARIINVIRDCGAKHALGLVANAEKIRKDLTQFSDQSIATEFIIHTIETIDDVHVEDWTEPEINADTLAFLQYTSGSTGTPKGVMVSHGNLIANQEAIAAATLTCETDLAVSWLPPYHDMGLIGTILHPLYRGFPAVLMPPMSFIQDPLSWLETMSRFRATLSGGPNFAYALCGQKATDDRLSKLNLSSWRVAFNGAEPIRPDTLTAFAERFAPCGFDPGALFPCYGLAEATLFVSGAFLNKGAQIQHISKKRLEQGQIVQEALGNTSQELVSCGQIIANHSVRIVSPEGIAVAAHQVGEIWIAGPSVAQGYWAKSDLTENLFNARLPGDDQRYLRTGDLGYINGDELIVTGRLKDLLIIRGRNHYPQDIEATAIDSHSALRLGCAAALSIDAESEKVVLVLEVDRRSHTINLDQVINTIRAAVMRAHEIELHDVVLIKAGTLPKTSSGKVRRQETRQQYLGNQLRTIASTPQPDVPQGNSTFFDRELLLQLPEAARQPLVAAQLQRLTGAVTKLDWRNIALDQSFSALGLSSIMAVQIKSRLERELGCAPSFNDLLGDKSIFRIAQDLVDSLAEPTKLPTSPPIDINTDESTAPAPQLTRYALSYNQQQLWFLYQNQPLDSTYNIAIAASTLQALDLERLRTALMRLVDRHEILRTTYCGDEEGNFQTIHDALEIDWVVKQGCVWTAREIEDYFTREAAEPFKLETGPILRVRAITSNHGQTWLLFCIHHIATDFWSLANLVRELTWIYSGEAPPLPIRSYLDFVEVQQEFLATPEAEAQLNYWRRELADLPAHRLLPVDHTGLAGSEGETFTFDIDASFTARAKAFAANHNTTLFTLLMTVFQVLLHRYCDQTDVVVGTPVVGHRISDFHNTQGYFVNPLIIRGRFGNDPTFESSLSQIGEAVRNAMDNQDYPLQLLVQKLRAQSISTSQPLFQVVFTFQQSQSVDGVEAFAVPGSNATVRINDLLLRSETVRKQHVPFDLSLTIAEVEGRLCAAIDYRLELFSPERIQHIAAHFKRLLITGLNQPEISVSQLPLDGTNLVPEAVKDITGSEIDRATSLISRFEQTVNEQPDAVALRFNGSPMTYSELNAAANRLARLIREQGCDRGSRVAIMVNRSPEMVISILSVLKAGAAYLPLDPNSPRNRLQTILEDGQPLFLISQRSLLADLDLPESINVIDLEAVQEQLTALAPTNLNLSIDRNDSAYIIFTSGSTGRPKGVEVSHDNVLQLFSSCQSYFQFDRQDVWSLFHSYAFDFSVWEIWGALLYGGRLVIVPYEVSRSPEDFYQLVVEEGVTILNQTPTAFRQFSSVDMAAPFRELALRFVIFGGEALNFRHLEDWFHKHGDTRPTLVNMYGITETTVHVTIRPICIADLAHNRSLIGKPLSHLQIFIMNKAGNPVPVGVEGEMYVAGAGLAKGYVSQPDLTKERFFEIEHSTYGKTRIYRTGDLARYTSSGDIEYLGRIDNQVKIRGFRIELGEIEDAITTFPQIKQAIAIVRSPEKERRGIVQVPEESPTDIVVGSLRNLLKRQSATRLEEPNEPKIYVYVVATGEIDISALYRHLTTRLPDYMLPAAVVPINAIPMNHNGKANITALPDPLKAGLPFRNSYEPPHDKAEQVMVEVFKQTLGLHQIGIHDRFFDLGGDSILSIQLRARALKAGFDVSIADIFRLQTPHELAKLGMQDGASLALSHHHQPFALISADDRQKLPLHIENAYPLSRLQAGLIFHSQYGVGTGIYCDVFSFRFQMVFAEAAMRSALATLVQRHPILRTSFDFAHFTEPLQLVHKSAQMPLEVFDLRHLSDIQQKEEFAAWLETEKQRGYDWEQPPLMRFAIHRVQDNEIIFNMSFHDSLLDGWSEASLITELMQTYLQIQQGLPPHLPKTLDTGYDDFVALEKQILSSPEAQTYWERALTDAVPTFLPRWHDRTSDVHDGTMGFLTVDISEQLSQGLKRLAVECGVPVKHVLLAAHARVISLLAGSDDIILAIESNGRLEEGDGDKVLGTHLNAVPLRLKLTGGSWQDLVRQTYQTEQETQPYRRFPYEEIQRCCGGRPLFDTSFNYTHFHVYQKLEALDGIKVIEAKAFIQTHFALRAEFNQDPFSKQITLDLEANIVDIDVEQLKSIGAYYQRALTEMVENPSGSYWDTCLLGAEELDQLLAATTVADAASRSFSHYLDQFEAQVAQTPNAIAAVFKGDAVTYRELNNRAMHLAHRMTTSGVTHGSIVAILAERSIDYLTAILAIFKLGAAFLPLPEGPHERIVRILQRCHPGLILGDATHQDMLERVAIATSTPMLPIESENTSVEPPPLPVIHRSVDDLAYVIFTSGSTGEPKGVMIEHKGMLNHIHAKIEDLAIGVSDVISQDAAATFDISVWQFLAVLLMGGQVHIFEDDIAKDPARLLDAVIQHKITVLEVSPSVLRVMLSDAVYKGIGSHHFNHLRWIVCSGETLRPELARQWKGRFPNVRLLNMWGATEVSDDCTHYEIQEILPDQRSVPVGKPIRNAVVYVLDQRLQPVPVGTPGELCIGGDCVGSGYINDVERTAAAFINNPFGAGGDRLYRSGDIGRRLPSGELEFIGRRDSQIKIRGFRVELGEIEVVLNQLPTIQEAVVVVKRNECGEDALVAYVVPKGETNQDRVDLKGDRAFDKSRVLGDLHRQLPNYMIPSAFVVLEQLPRNVNGKVDRTALPTPSTLIRDNKQNESLPATLTEEIVIAICQTVLDYKTIDLNANFFEIGGHSLLATQVVSRVRDTFCIELPLKALFTASTIREFCHTIDATRTQSPGRSGESAKIERAMRGARLPLSFNQQRLWFIYKLDPSSTAYCNHVAMRLHGPLNRSALQTAIRELLQRHEILRTRFLSEDGIPYQVIDDNFELPLSLVDLSTHASGDLELCLGSALNREVEQPFNLEDCPPIRYTLFILDNNDHVLLSSSHHILSDGWSTNVIFRDLAALYRAIVEDSDSGLEELPIQFVDYAVWQQAFLKSRDYEQQLSYWRQHLSGYSGFLDLPTDRARPRIQSYRGDRINILIDQATTERIHALCRDTNVTAFIVLQTVLAILLSRYTKEHDIVIGSPVANRNRSELEHLIGFFANTLPFRHQINPDLDVISYLKHARQVALDAYACQEVPFDQIVQSLNIERNASYNPLIQVMFVLQNVPAKIPVVEGLHLTPLEVTQAVSRFDLLLNLTETDRGLEGFLEYNTDLFEETTIRTFIEHFHVLLSSMLQCPTQLIRQLDILTPEEQSALKEIWVATRKNYSSERCGQLFDGSEIDSANWNDFVEEASRVGLFYSVLAGLGNPQ